LLDVIRWSLKLDPLERPQSVFALQKALREPVPEKKGNETLQNFSRKVRGLFSRFGKDRDSLNTIQETTQYQ
jgi:hypothetical protein